jgi:hypothetical protein
MVYLSKLQAAQTIQHRIAGKITKDECRRMWKDEVLSYNGNIFTIPLQTLRKAMKILYQVKCYFDRDPNQTPLGHKAEM